MAKKRSSRPVWGAWIEILLCVPGVAGFTGSRPVWGAWIEIATTRRLVC